MIAKRASSALLAPNKPASRGCELESGSPVGEIVPGAQRGMGGRERIAHKTRQAQSQFKSGVTLEISVHSKRGVHCENCDIV